MKILGIQFCKNLKWVDQAKQVVTKLHKVLNLVKVLAAGRKGAPPSALIRIARPLINGITGYGLTLFGDCSPTHLNKIQIAINKILRAASGAYCSTPTPILLAECGVWNIEDRILKLRLKLASRQVGDPRAPLYNISYNFIQNDLRNRTSTLRRAIMQIPTLGGFFPIPPPPIVTIDQDRHISNFIIDSLSSYSKDCTNTQIYRALHRELCAKYADRIHIYTDASKTNNGTGLSVVYRNEAGSWITLVEKRLPRNTAVFDAELAAVWLAAGTTSRKNKKVVIFSDSLSSIQAIKNNNNNDFMVDSIRHLLIKKETILCWIPGHVGIAGNEHADQAAKSATVRLNEAEVFALPSPQAIYNLGLKSLFSRRLNVFREGDSDTISAYLELNPRLITPTFSPSLSRADQTNLIRLRMGHTRLTHPFPVSVRATATCPFCNEALHHDSIQLLRDCAAVRAKLAAFGILELSRAELLASHQTADSLLFRLLDELGLADNI